MGFFEVLTLIWSPMWFCWDLAGTVGILYLVRNWIKGSVTQTKNKVIEELCQKKTFKKVRKAMGIPNAAKIRSIIRSEILAQKLSTSGLKGSEMKKEIAEAKAAFHAQMPMVSQSSVVNEGVMGYLMNLGIPDNYAKPFSALSDLALKGGLIEFFGPSQGRSYYEQLKMALAAGNSNITTLSTREANLWK